MGKGLRVCASLSSVVRLAAHVSNGLKSRIRPVVGRMRRKQGCRGRPWTGLHICGSSRLVEIFQIG